MLVRVITGVTGDQVFPACFLNKVRIGGTANLVGAVQVKQGSTVLETFAAATVPGVEREYSNLKFVARAVKRYLEEVRQGENATVETFLNAMKLERKRRIG